MFPSPPGTFLLSIVYIEAGTKTFPSFRPHRGLFFYLFTEKECYIYAMNVSVPTGDFSFIYDSQIESEKRKIHVSVPTGDFSFIYCLYRSRNKNIP